MDQLEERVCDAADEYMYGGSNDPRDEKPPAVWPDDRYVYCFSTEYDSDGGTTLVDVYDHAGRHIAEGHLSLGLSNLDYL